VQPDQCGIKHWETVIRIELKMDRIFDIEYIAEYFKCSLEKVKRMLRSGKLPGFKFGGRWYVREKDLEAMVDRAVQSNRHLRRVQEAA